MKLTQLVNESVSFFVDYRDENENFKDILSMCFHLQRLTFKNIQNDSPFLYKHLVDQNHNKGNGIINFDPDGDSYNQRTGVINVYPGKLINDHFAKDFMSALHKAIEQLKHKVKVGKVTMEGKKIEWDKPRSAHKEGDSFSNVGVIRVPILGNESEPVKFKEMNIANDNARALLRLLGIQTDPDDLGGVIKYENIPKLMMRIRNISKDKINANNREPEEHQATIVDKSGDVPRITKGMKMYDMGLDSSRIKQYLDGLMDILKQAHENKLNVNFG